MRRPPAKTCSTTSSASSPSASAFSRMNSLSSSSLTSIPASSARRSPGGRRAPTASCPTSSTDTDRWSDFTAEEVVHLVAAIEACRSEAGITASLEVAVGGGAGCRRWTTKLAAVDAAARGGATWWLEFVRSGPDGDMLAAVRRGPVRATATP